MKNNRINLIAEKRMQKGREKYTTEKPVYDSRSQLSTWIMKPGFHKRTRLFKVVLMAAKKLKISCSLST